MWRLNWLFHLMRVLRGILSSREMWVTLKPSERSSMKRITCSGSFIFLPSSMAQVFGGTDGEQKRTQLDRAISRRTSPHRAISRQGFLGKGVDVLPHGHF